MIQKRTKYPIGVQDFEGLIHDGYKYVDKTGLMWRLTDELKYVFLSRPRRFGKSLLLSTLKAFFEGKRDLFKGLAVDELETEWTASPVLYLDLNAQRYDSVEALCSVFHARLTDWEAQYQLEANGWPLSIRFNRVIRAAHEQTGHRVVILVDEYDKPMVMNMRRPELQDELREQLKAFYGVMKSEDAHIRFAMLTGVTKFTKVSVFSDLNNLTDISMNKRYATLCGLTRQEILENFSAELDALAEAKGMTREACVETLRRYYDGYHFAPDTEGIYNPFSVINALRAQQFGNYWFETGTPTLLYDMMRETDDELTSPLQPNDLFLYQMGFLTIKDYDREFDEYTYTIPNDEVRRTIQFLRLQKDKTGGEM